MEFSHYSVMLNECIDGLNIKPDGIYVDCTAGGGGHSEEILKRLITGKLISIDQDDAAISTCKEKFKKYGERSIIVKNNFSELNQILNELNIVHIDGVLMDLGVSSHQLDTPVRGFSYNSDAELDMRMNPCSPFSAYDVVNTYSEFDLKRIIRDYGEEKFAHLVAKKMMSGGTTVVIVSHSIEQIERLCDRVVWLDHGKVVMIGETAEVCNQYRNMASR